MLGIGAKAVPFVRNGERAPHAVDRLQRSDGFLLRQITQTQSAALARGVLEEKRLTAVLTFEQSHGPGPLVRTTGWAQFNVIASRTFHLSGSARSIRNRGSAAAKRPRG